MFVLFIILNLLNDLKIFLPIFLNISDNRLRECDILQLLDDGNRLGLSDIFQGEGEQFDFLPENNEKLFIYICTLLKRMVMLYILFLYTNIFYYFIFTPLLPDLLVEVRQ